jgi:hypothetical protein
MPLPIDVQTLPLFVWESVTGNRIDSVNDLEAVLVWMRAGNLVFWWLLLWYARLTGRLLAGVWGGRLAVALLACEPNLLAHAALATTDISVSACLLALVYHFRVGREAGWMGRIGLPALWLGLAILAKASAIVYAPICLVAVEVDRLFRSEAFATASGIGWRQQLMSFWQQTRPARRDLARIGLGGLAVTVIYCGTDFCAHPEFVQWAHRLPESSLANGMVWFAENLCIFSNAAEGIVRQVRHNVRGHGTFLLGQGYARAVWFYFPVLLTIKLSVPVLLAPLLILAAGRPRALMNWVCATALVLLVFSLTFRVQIGIRLVLPLVTLGIVGLAAAVVNAIQSSGRRSNSGTPYQSVLPQGRWSWRQGVLIATVAGGLLWTTAASATVWPHGLCYVNPLWGGTERGYELVSDSNYDWGQGMPELMAWQRQHATDLDLWFFGFDHLDKDVPVQSVPLHAFKIDGPEDVVSNLRARYLAVGTSMLYGQVTLLESHRNAAAFLRECEPAARTMTFLIFERQSLIEACHRKKLAGGF